MSHTEHKQMSMSYPAFQLVYLIAFWETTGILTMCPPLRLFLADINLALFIIGLLDSQPGLHSSLLCPTLFGLSVGSRLISLLIPHNRLTFSSTLYIGWWTTCLVISLTFPVLQMTVGGRDWWLRQICAGQTDEHSSYPAFQAPLPVTLVILQWLTGMHVQHPVLCERRPCLQRVTIQL